MRRIKFVILNFFCISICAAQVRPIENGVMKSRNNVSKETIEITFKNDTAYGPFKILDLNGKIINSGIIDNRFITYKTSGKKVYSNDGPGIFAGSYPIIEKNIQFKDTNDLLGYYNLNSFKSETKFYYPTGKLKSKVSYSRIKYKDQFFSILKDTLFEYEENGKISKKSYATYVTPTLIKETRISYNLKKIIEFSCYFLDMESNNKYGIWYNFDSKGRLMQVNADFGSKENVSIDFIDNKMYQEIKLIRSEVNTNKKKELELDKNGEEIKGDYVE